MNLRALPLLMLLVAALGAAPHARAQPRRTEVPIPRTKPPLPPPDAPADPPLPKLAVPRGGRTEAHHMARLEQAQLLFTTALHAHESGELQRAAAAYSRAIELDGGMVEALVNLARVRIEQGREDNAEQLLARAQTTRPDYPQTYAALGWLAARRGQGGVARAELERALALDPTSVEVRVNLAAVLIEHGSLSRAAALLERARELDPASARASFNLALAHDQLGDAARARQIYFEFLAQSAAADPLRALVVSRIGELERGMAAAAPFAAPPSTSPDAELRTAPSTGAETRAAPAAPRESGPDTAVPAAADEPETLPPEPQPSTQSPN